ncbi:MAG TPA: N-acetylmuramoyl-L-alanine amidase [Caulobacteraceae bacterium]
MSLPKSLGRFTLVLWALVAMAGPVLAQNGQAGIDVRVGYGADATRVVVDSPVPVTGRREDSGADEVNYMLRGPDAGILLQGLGHGLVRAWRLDAGEGGSRLTLDLNGRSRVVRTFVIPPSAESAMYRYVIDLARADDVSAKAPTVIAGAAPKDQARVEVAARPATVISASALPPAPAAPAIEPRTVVATRYPVPLTPWADQVRPERQAAAAPRPASPRATAPSKDAVAVLAVSRAPRRTGKLIREPTDASAVAQQSALPPAPPAERERPAHVALAARKVIVIDAGHGGHDPGAQSDGENEKDITLAAALHLRHRLLRDGQYRVVMTRSSDVFVPLETRVSIARQAGADLFIALHADSAGDNDATHGASVYTLSGHGETRVKEVLTGREWFAKAAPRNDPAVKGILLDLTQRSTLNRSNEFAQLLVDRLSEKIDVLPKSHRDAGYFVLLAPDVPAVLLEMGFITSPLDQARLTSPARRNALMDMVGDAIDEYFRGEMRVAEN